MIKKILLAAVTAAIAFAQPAYGAAMNVGKQLLMVPWAYYTSTTTTTAVGIGSRYAGEVYWAFFDANGNRRAHGHFAVGEFSRTPFIWSAAAAASGESGLDNLDGYLLFGLDTSGDARIDGTDSGRIGGNAFYVDTTANDVAYIPILGFDSGHLSQQDTSQWTNDPIADLPDHEGWAADTGKFAKLGFMIDGAAGGDDTTFYIWTSHEVGSSQSMTVYDGDGASKTVSVPLLNDHLNVLDPEQHPAIDSAFYGDGFVNWLLPKASDGTTDIQAFMFSIVSSDAFGAAQTLMGNIIE